MKVAQLPSGAMSLGQFPAAYKGYPRRVGRFSIADMLRRAVDQVGQRVFAEIMGEEGSLGGFSGKMTCL